MSDRYFIQPPITADRAVLNGPEAHHFIHVMRARPGDRATLFDGSGAEFAAEVLRVDRTGVELAILSRQPIDRELPVALVLGVALPKGDRQKWLVEKAVEIGLRRIVPLQTARGVAQPADKTLDRLRRTVIEASKQCGRNQLMEIGDPRSWADFLAETAAMPCRLLAHPADGERQLPAPGAASGDLPLDVPPAAALAIGPEGGFTKEEVGLALAAGWRRVYLGPRILRVETAAIFLTAMVLAEVAAK